MTINNYFYLIILFILIINAFIGSFLNVVIYRLPRMLENTTWPYTNKPINFLFPHSHCPQCQQRLGIQQLIPLISYILSKGHCRFCQQTISTRYFLVELLTVVLSLALILSYHLSWQFLILSLFSWYSIIISFIDIEHLLIPDSLSYSLLWIGLLLSTMPISAVKPTDAIIGAFSAYTLLWLIAKTFQRIHKKEAMGHGDFKLFAALAAWTGWQFLPLMLISATFTALIYGLMHIGMGKQNKPIPFAPFLCASAWLLLYFYHPLSHFHLQRILI
ncbi:MAG: A24 family peptidase [Pseudomonadota bacterium]